MHYTITVRPESTRFKAICPELPGVVGVGATAGQALDAALATLTERLESRGDSAPTIAIVRATLEILQPKA